MPWDYDKRARQNKASGTRVKVQHSTRWYEKTLANTLRVSTCPDKQRNAVKRALAAGVTQKRIDEIHKEAGMSRTRKAAKA